MFALTCEPRIETESDRGCCVQSIAQYMGPVARQLLNAWSALPKRDLVPMRVDFEPRAIVPILPVVSLLERVGAGEWRFRLVGTELERRWDRVLTGSDYFALVGPEAAAVVRREFAAVLEQPCASWSIRCVEFESGRRVGMEALRLPLRARDGSLSLILSCSGEVTGRRSRDPDRPRHIPRVTRQRFIDIGAGVPGATALDEVQPGG